MSFFGNNIKTLRQEKKLSQNKLAEILETTRTSIANWELENSFPRIPDLIRIAAYFDVSIDSLLLDDLENTDSLPLNTSERSIPQSHVNKFLEAFDLKGARKGIQSVVATNNNLSQTVKNMSETNLKLASAVDRLMAFLENK